MEALESAPMRAQVDVLAERVLQEAEYGNLADDTLMPAEWIARIAKHTGRAVTHDRHVYRKQLVIIGALALAALEAYDRKYNLELE